MGVSKLGQKKIKIVGNKFRIFDKGVRHLTNGNCKMPCSGILGFRSAMSVAFGSLPRLTPTTFLKPCKPTVCLSGLQKCQLPRTLCASFEET
jgi:hypothetical protein